MSLMMLLPVKKKEAERLLRIIEKSIPGQEIEICHSVASLSERLHKPTLDVILIILFITSGLELTKILGMKDALEGLKIIVILPDHDPEMITRSHTLRPRYLTWSARRPDGCRSNRETVNPSRCADECCTERLSVIFLEDRT